MANPTLGPDYTQTWTDFMLELLLVLQRAYRSGGVLADQYQRGNLQDHQYEENTARITILRNVKQGTGFASELGVLPVGRKVRTMKANVGIASIEHTIALSKRLPRVSGNKQTSFAQAAELEMSMAQEAMIKTRNELLNGDGTGLIATITGTGTTGTTVVAPVANANMALLYRGRVGDILVRSTRAVVKQGVMISDISEVAGSETISLIDAADDTATVAAVDNTMGFYLESGASVTTSDILQGWQAAIAQTGTFEGLDRNIYKDWKATDGRAGNVTAADLGVAIMDGCVRRRGSHLTPGQQFKSLWISDPAVLDKFSQSLLSGGYMRWGGDKGTLDTGFEYINYKGERLFSDYDAPLSQIVCIPLDDVQILEIGSGPSFDDQDGSIWKRFARSQPVEAWLIAEEQAAYTRVDRFVFAQNLNRAA